MRRMFSKNQLEELIKEYAPEVSPEDIQKMFDEGEVSLDGKYVRIMDAPTSTTLTDEEKEKIIKGIFIEGVFLGYRNPVLCPAHQRGTGYTGFFIAGGTVNESGVLKSYSIGSDNNITLSTVVEIVFDLGSDTVKIKNASITSSLTILGKLFPAFPNATDIKKLIFRKGNLEWYEPISQSGVSSGDTIALTSDLGKALLDHLEVEINGHRCRFESEEESGSSTYVIYSSFGEVSATGKLTANIISYNKSNGEISFNQMTFTPDA